MGNRGQNKRPKLGKYLGGRDYVGKLSPEVLEVLLKEKERRGQSEKEPK